MVCINCNRPITDWPSTVHTDHGLCSSCAEVVLEEPEDFDHMWVDLGGEQ